MKWQFNKHPSPISWGRAYYKEKNATTLQNFNVVVIIFWTYISHICQINASIGVLLLSKKVGLPLIYIQAEKTHEALKYHQYPPNAYGKKREKLKRDDWTRSTNGHRIPLRGRSSLSYCWSPFPWYRRAVQLISGFVIKS